jgi:hypothetical protein
MRTIAFAGFCACLFAFALPAAPAQAGGYGIGVHGPGYVWYSSSCCYRRVVRHRRDVFYVRAGAYLPRTAGYSGYGECRRIPLADGRGGWVWSRRAGCF